MKLKKMEPFSEKDKKSKKQIELYIEDMKKGKKDVIADLYNLTKTSIYGYALSIMKNKSDAEDILQEVYIKIYQNANKYIARGKPMNWIIQITKNLCYMELRKNKSTVDIGEITEIISDDKNLVNEDRLLIYNIFKYLSEEERQIITLHIISGFKHREIAEILDIPVSTVLSKYNRAIKKVKNKMKEEV